VDLAEARRRFGDARVARPATVRPDGSPHLVPIVFALERDTLYFAVDEKPKRSARLQRIANVEHEPRVSALVDAYDEDWSRLWWVRIDGRAHIVAEGPDLERVGEVPQVPRPSAARPSRDFPDRALALLAGGPIARRLRRPAP
jgi:PPOX class probable F420-dependent enzyme